MSSQGADCRLLEPTPSRNAFRVDGRLAASSFRFFAEAATDGELKAAHAAILAGQTCDLRRTVYQTPPPKPRNGAIHKPATPTQDVLVLAESAMPYQVVNSKKPARTAKRLKHALR